MESNGGIKEGVRMKRYLLALAVLLGASQGAGAQMMNGGGGAGDWEFRIGPVFTESKNIKFDGGTTAEIGRAHV